LKHHRKKQRGFTLLEVLVALIVLSVGLLGLTGLQANSLRNNHGAFLRSQATVAINDIMDRMRANRAEAKDGGYALAFATTKGSLGVPCTTCTTPQQLRTRDQVEWLDQVERLPGGDGEIEIDSAALGGDRDLVIVRVRWDEDRTNDPTQFRVLEMRTQL
jgi:type IV pilus assembly protein PilV